MWRKRHPGIISKFFDIYYDVSYMDFPHMAFIISKRAPSRPNALRTYITRECSVSFLECFSLCITVILWFLSFLLLIWFITFVCLGNLDLTWLWCMCDLFKHVVEFGLLVFYSWNVLSYSSILADLLGFRVKIMLVLWP